MMLPDKLCILHCIIYIRSKFSVGIANWKNSHCLCFPLGRLAVNIKLQRFYGFFFFQKSPIGCLLIFLFTHRRVLTELVSVLWELESMRAFGCCSLSWILWEWQPSKPWAPSLERKADVEAQSACIAARTARGRAGGSGCALHCYGSEILRLNVQTASGPPKMNHYRSWRIGLYTEYQGN